MQQLENAKQMVKLRQQLPVRGYSFADFTNTYNMLHSK